MVDRFLARFGNNIAVLHSKLSTGERYDEWQKIKNGEVKIVIGARSAIFAPLQKIGIILIDEEHDMSYKSDTTPRYNAKDLAKYIAEKNNCPLVLGSATPDMETFYEAKECIKSNLYTLTKRANQAQYKTQEVPRQKNKFNWNSIDSRGMTGDDYSWATDDPNNPNWDPNNNNQNWINKRQAMLVD